PMSADRARDDDAHATTVDRVEPGPPAHARQLVPDRGHETLVLRAARLQLAHPAAQGGRLGGELLVARVEVRDEGREVAGREVLEAPCARLRPELDDDEEAGGERDGSE